MQNSPISAHHLLEDIVLLSSALRAGGAPRSVTQLPAMRDLLVSFRFSTTDAIANENQSSMSVLATRPRSSTDAFRKNEERAVRDVT